jgi:hypothetical protein
MRSLPGKSLVLPPDIGAEAKAMIDLDELCDWAGAGQVEAVEPFLFRIEAHSGERLLVRVDPIVHAIVDVRSLEDPARVLLTLVHFSVVPQRAEWFEMEHTDPSRLNLDGAGVAWGDVL